MDIFEKIFPQRDLWFQNQYPQVAQMKQTLRDWGIYNRPTSALPSRIFNDYEITLAIFIFLQFDGIYQPETANQYYKLIFDIHQRHCYPRNNNSVDFQVSPIEFSAYLYSTYMEDPDLFQELLEYYDSDQHIHYINVELKPSDFDKVYDIEGVHFMSSLKREVKENWHIFFLRKAFEYLDILQDFLPDQETLGRIQYWRTIIQRILNQQLNILQALYNPQVVADNKRWREKLQISKEILRFQSLAMWDKILDSVQRFTRLFIYDIANQMDFLNKYKRQFFKRPITPDFSGKGGKKNL